MMSSSFRHSTVLGATVLAATILFAPLSAHAVDEKPGGLGLDVPVIGGPASPSPSTPPVAPSPAAPATDAPAGGGMPAPRPSGPSAVPAAPPRLGSGTGAPVVTQTTVADPVTAADALGEEPFNLDGLLYASGLSASVSTNALPGNGPITLSVTVKNASDAEFDASARFWVDGPFGVRVADVGEIPVAGLGAGETRTVHLSVPNPGQWTFFTGHVTVSSPATVGGDTRNSVTRDASIFLVPWFSILLIGIPAAGWGAWSMSRRVRALAPVRVSAA